MRMASAVVGHAAGRLATGDCLARARVRGAMTCVAVPGTPHAGPLGAGPWDLIKSHFHLPCRAAARLVHDCFLKKGERPGSPAFFRDTATERYNLSASIFLGHLVL